MAKKKKPVLFVMMGGGARGIECHTGICKAMEKLKIEAQEYRGASAGAIISTFKADGHKSKDIVEMMKNNPFSSLIEKNWGWFWWLNVFGIIYDRTKLNNLIKKMLGDRVYENVVVTVTRYKDGESIKMHGSAETCIASSSIPVVFPPHEIDGVKYVDGGVKDNIPTPNGIDRENYEHIYIFLTNDDIDKNRHYNSRVGRALKWFDETCDREVNQVYADWSGFDNVTIIKPSPFKSSLLDWSDDFGLVEHAYKETLELLKDKKPKRKTKKTNTIKSQKKKRTTKKTESKSKK